MQRTKTTTITTLKKGSGQSKPKNQNHNKNKKQKPKNQKRSGVAMTECGYKYMLAVANPFDPRSQGACIPSFPSRRSQKVAMTCRGTMTIGTTGYGVIYMAPSIANDAPAIFYTNSTYNGLSTDTPVLVNGDITSGEWSVTNPIGPYSRANVTNASIENSNATSGRIVSAGLRVSYTGKVTDMSGTILCYTNPDHSNMCSYSLGATQALPEAKIERVSTKPCYLIATPVDVDETEYNFGASATAAQTFYPFNGGNATTRSFSNGTYEYGPMIGVVFATGEPGSTFFFEYIQHTEFIGPQTQAAQTPNAVDHPAFEAVLSAATQSSGTGGTLPGKSFTQSVIDRTKEALTSVSGVYSALPPRTRSQIAGAATDWVLSQSQPRGQLQLR